MKTTIPILLLCALAVLGLAVPAPAATHSVTVQGLSFNPKDLTVAIGDTVVFSSDGGNHTVTGDGAEPFCGMSRFTTCSVTFSNVGAFPYHCIPHLSFGMTGVVHVVTAENSLLRVVINGMGTVSPFTNGQSLFVGGSFTITAAPAHGFGFAGWTGGVTSNTPQLIFVMQPNLTLEANFADTTPPEVTITAPLANARLASNTVTLEGAAHDGDAVATVEYRVENAAGPGLFQAADGTNSWSAAVLNMAPGTNRFHVRARDLSGNMSAEALRAVLVLSRLTVTTHGIGMVPAGFLGSTFRDPARLLSITATPKPGFLFSNWTGNIESIANPLRFVPSSNMTLQANFVANPFLPVSGSYNGLFHVDDQVNGARHESSGVFTFLLTGLGKYSGSLQLAGRRHPFSGQFDLAGHAANAVKRPGTNALSMELTLDLNGGSDRVDGTVTNTAAGWVAAFMGDRAPSFPGTNTSQYRGRYTLLVTGEDEAGIGNGFGTAVVSPKGRLNVRATLADGTPVTQSVPVSRDGQWPLYVALYGGKGSILSWASLTTDPAPADSLYGELSWTKPGLPGARYYPAGFTNAMDIVGSVYEPRGTNRVLQIDMGTVTFEGGNLAGAFTNLATLGAKNKLTNLTTNQPLIFNITVPTGLFTGSVKVNDSGVDRKLIFKGALLQRQNLGGGFFLGTDESGPVRFEPQP